MSANSQKYNALLATDDREMPRLIATIMVPAGFEMKAIGTKALDEEIHKDTYSIIIVDGNLPGPVSVNESAIVAISPDDPIATYDLGADLVIDKPLITNVFLAKVRAVLRRFGIKI